MFRRILSLLYLGLGCGFFQPLLAQDTNPAASPTAPDSNPVPIPASLQPILAYQQAAAAFRNDDDGAMLAAARQVLESWPDHAGARYLFALGRARQGWLGDAARALGQLAQQGLTTRLEAETAFAPLAKEAEYAELRRQLQSNRLTQGESSLVYQLALEHFIPEGLTRRDDGSVLLGSVYQSQIVEIPASQASAAEPETRLWASADDAHHGLCSVLSLRESRFASVENAASSRRVFAATACMPQTATAPAERLGQSGILVYRGDGELLAQHWLPSPDTAQHVLGDLVEIAPDQLITSDSLGGGIYQLDLVEGTYRALIPAGVLPNPQGLARAADGAIYVADYQAGLFRFEPEHGLASLQRLANPSGAALHGIDGLQRCGNELLAIQNGVRPNRIMAFTLDAGGKSLSTATVLARGLAEWDEPTQTSLDQGGLLYVANSHWPQFDSTGKLAATALDGPRLMRIERPSCGSAHSEDNH